MQLISDKNIKGEIKSFPFVLSYYEGWGTNSITINNHDELINYVITQSKKDYNKEKDFKTLLEDIGINDTIMLADKRTMEIIEEYFYYSSKATGSAPYDCELWFYTVLACKKLEVF